MELPPTAARYDHKLRFGRYVAGRLRLRKLSELADRIERSTNQLRDVSQRLDEVSAQVHEALAARDHFVEGLVSKARGISAKLDSTPMARAASMRIFDPGLDRYTAAPLVEIEARFKELLERVEQHLVYDEKLRSKTAKTLRIRLKGFRDATHLLSESRAALFDIRGKREKSVKRWDKLLRDIHAQLVEDLGEALAESLFPQVARTQSHDGEDRGKFGDLRGIIDKARLESRAKRSKG